MNQDFVAGKSQKNEKQPKIIKRYGNRKLYDTEQSSYVVLSDIAKMLRNKEDIRVIDNETKDDITNSTFTQIIFGAEKKANQTAPLDILKNIITEGDGSLSNYLAKIGLYKPSARVEKSTERPTVAAEGRKFPTATPKETPRRKTTSLEERLVNAASSSHDIIEDVDLPKLPNSNKNLDSAT